MNRHALDVLELGEALSGVARLASSALGAEAIRASVPSLELPWIRDELSIVSEAMGLLRKDEGWGPPPIPDLRAALRVLAVEGSVWEPTMFRDAAVLLRSSAAARRQLHAEGERAPRLARVGERMADLGALAGALERIVDPDGLVRDDASPELARIRREIQGARSRIVAKLTAYMASLPTHLQVGDASVSVREGRYVVPVRREGRGEVGGIVHGESGTGATLFVEPPVAIEMMNRLRELESGEAREVQRILREHTTRVRAHHAELVESLDALVRLDSVHARARYARRYDAEAPEMLPAGTEEYRVVLGRHPLLLARSEPVVPFELTLEPGERTLLISGPNTGGKTVLLKAIGLLSVMAQCGIVPPLGPGSRLPLFRNVFADIGDEQSIEASLSTFSAHLKNLRETLAGADGESLVLIDELGSGTDPQEGGALAQAILFELTRRGALTVATTHLGQLKLIASEDPRIVNASMQFDAERLEPTYRLVKGVPGRSYGLAIARRLGLPGDVLGEAESYLPSGERDVARLLLELEAKEQEVSRLSGSLEAQLRETERLRAELEDREQTLQRREKDAERRARQQARDLLLRSRKEVEEAIQQVRSVADERELEEAARAARRRVEEAARQQKERVPQAPAREPARRVGALPLEVGVRVRILSLGTTGKIVELREGRAMVETGGLRMKLPLGDLEGLPAGDQQPSRPRNRGGFIDAEFHASTEVDLRGMRADEIELQLGRALDNALLSGLPSFRIIHGKGTGALRAQVKELLQADPRISSFRPGERFEGGSGVTVVEF